jgi:hypothetical protein
LHSVVFSSAIWSSLWATTPARRRLSDSSTSIFSFSRENKQTNKQTKTKNYKPNKKIGKERCGQYVQQANGVAQFHFSLFLILQLLLEHLVSFLFSIVQFLDSKKNGNQAVKGINRQINKNNNNKKYKKS